MSTTYHQRVAVYGPIMMVPVQVPSSNQLNIVFPLERKTFRFDPTKHNYNRMMTQNRLSETEMDQILSDIEVPLQEYYNEFSSLYNGNMVCYAIICAILFPLLFFYLCWNVSLQNRAIKQMALTRQKVEAIIQQKNQELERRDLRLVLPSLFPNWIELWTTTGNQVPMPGQNYQMMMAAKPGIQMNVVPQQGQPGYYNDQFNEKNNYGAAA